MQHDLNKITRCIFGKIAPWNFAWGLMGDLILQGDPELSLVALIRKVASERPARTIVRTSPKGSKGSLGGVERAHRSVKALARALKFHDELMYGVWIPLTSVMIPWLLRWAACLLNYFVIRGDGRTVYQKICYSIYI